MHPIRDTLGLDNRKVYPQMGALDLVYRWHDFSGLQELVQPGSHLLSEFRSLVSGGYIYSRLDRKVADSYCSDSPGFQQLLHLRPGLVESHVGKAVPSFGPMHRPGVLSHLWKAQITQPGTGKVECVHLP